MSDQPVGPFFDASGRRMKDGPAPQAADVTAAVRAALNLPAEAWRPAAPVAGSEITGTACFELHVGPPLQVFSSGPAFEPDSGSAVIQIQATVDLSWPLTYPFHMLAINVSGDIYQPPLGPGWHLIEGYFSEQTSEGFPLSIQAQLGPGQNELLSAQGIDYASGATTFSAIGWWYQGPDSWGGVFSYDGDWPLTCRILFRGWQACS